MDATTGYAKRADGHLAFSVVGGGPIDLLYMSSNTISIDSLDEEPHVARYFGRLASFSRLIRFDIRGVGLSDPIDASSPPTVEDMAQDAIAVLDAVGSDRAAVVADAGGGGLSAIELAAAAPARASALVLINAYARAVADDDYPAGVQRELIESFLTQNTDPDDAWTLDGAGEFDDLSLNAPSLCADQQYRAWWLRAGRRGASPATARAILTVTALGDVRHRLRELSLPVLVLHRTDNRFIPPALGRYVAEHVAGARYVELPGADHSPWSGDVDAIVDEIEEFLTGTRRGPEPERVLATLLFTDIVGSTERAVEVGDHRWRDTLDEFRSLVRSELTLHRGREVNTRGDDFLATFEAPARAVACAAAIAQRARRLGLDVRSGVHTGEVALQGDDITGIAVHIGARVAALAAPGEVLATRTVRDLTAGSSLRFTDRGDYVLKGVPDPWQLFAVEL